MVAGQDVKDLASTVRERVDQLWAEHDELERRRVDARNAALDLESQLRNLEVAQRAVETAKISRREAVQQRWDARRALRQAVAEAVPLETPRGFDGGWRKPGRQWVQRHARALYEISGPVDPDACGAGVYVLFDGGDVTYVGQAVNVLARIGQHAGVKQFQRVAFIPCPRRRLDQLERALIDALLPRDNCDSRTRALRGLSEVQVTP